MSINDSFLGHIARLGPEPDTVRQQFPRPYHRSLHGVLLGQGVALCLLACDQTSNLLKYSVARLRPCYSDRMVLHGLHVLETRGSLFGFFSAHAANAFGFAAGTTTCFRYDTTHTYKGYIKCVYIWAALVSASRMFVGKHYFGDILVGAIIGCLWGYFLALGARWIFRRIDAMKQDGAEAQAQ